MKRVLILLFSLLPASLILFSCSYSSPSRSGTGSALKYRAFITNSVAPAGVYLLNAQTDVRPQVSPISAGNTPGMIVLTPNRNLSLVFSGNRTQFSDNQLTVVVNATESAAGSIALPGFTESIVVSPDGSAAYAAIPTASVVGQSPGVVKAISLNSGSFTGEVDVPSVHYLAIDNSGNRILGFSDNSDSVAVITPSNIGTGNAVTLVGGFDRPVAAFFSSDDTIAYVLNCGAECGGTTASVQQFNLTSNTLGSYVPVCAPGPTPGSCAGFAAGSVALVDGSTMYVAGTPPYVNGVPQQSCVGESTATQSPSCGLLTTIDLASMAVTNSGIVITDGYHNRMALGPDGQLFIGARTCTEITTATETRGCLSIYNTLNPPGGVLIPSANGEVTSIEPIAKRTVVYVIQNHSLTIYDTKNDALYNNPNDPNNPGQIFGLVGQFVDVKVVDF